MALLAKGWRNENTDDLKAELKVQLKIFNNQLKETYFGGMPVSQM